MFNILLEQENHIKFFVQFMMIQGNVISAYYSGISLTSIL
ncbi:hypothetical protein LPE509_02264 [Legionella pneumophila subsp. pneumophila LPE509]|nr:hypothetical protein LPE509_02264 [Legionella pneumophila subsp. pneumophila LPE509]